MRLHASVAGLVVLAHRGNISGREPATENSLGAMAAALEMGCGVETDIRRAADGRFYISHDPIISEPAERLAADHTALWRRYPTAVIALNVKELGYEGELVRFLECQGVLRQSFLFDMELLESAPGESARRIQHAHPWARVAVRVSDRREPLAQALASEARIVWLDEFDELWARQQDLKALKGAGKTVFAVSPELHGFPLDVARRRWCDFLRWGVDGICTDLAADLLLLRATIGPT